MYSLAYSHFNTVHSVKSVCKSSCKHICPARRKTASKQRCKTGFFELFCKRHIVNRNALHKLIPERIVKSRIYIIRFCLKGAFHYIRHHPWHYHIDNCIDAFSCSCNIIRIRSIYCACFYLAASDIICNFFCSFFFKINESDFINHILSCKN